MPPPEKKTKTAAAALSPFATYFKRLDAAVEKNENGLDYILIRGVLQEDEEDEEDETIIRVRRKRRRKEEDDDEEEEHALN